MRNGLVLVSGTGDSSKLAKKIHRELRTTYNMGDSVSLLIPEKPSNVDSSLTKNRMYPPVLGMFSDGETRADIGKNELYNNIRGKHVAIVKYMFTPKREPDMHINDHIMEVKALLDIFKHTDTLRKTLAVPYLPYLRSHSIEKYEKKGFFQFDSLMDMVESFKSKNLEGIICIDPHSDKIIEKGREFNIKVNVTNPFHSTEYVNPYKLGLNNNSEDVLSELQPFLEYFKKIKELEENKNKKFKFVSLDDGAERRTEQFIRNSGLGWDDILYVGKTRSDFSKPKFQIKKFSRIDEENLIKNAVYIFLDDMIDSGGTANGFGEHLKMLGARNVELWSTHPLAPDRKKIMDLRHIKKIVALDTILHKRPEEMNIGYIESAHHLLAAELFKAHMKLGEIQSTYEIL